MVKQGNTAYSKKVVELFQHPRNMGEIKNADAIGTVGNPTCGDVMKLYLKIDKKNISGKEKETYYIKDVKFQTMGCGAAIAVSSMLTELAKGKTIEEAKKITNADIAKKLGGLPPIKYHCSLLGAEALHAAIKNLEEKKKKLIS
jgi:nitrogen fixation NifU-like protein